MKENCRTSLPMVERYMHECMGDAAHDREHIYRVLNYALYIAEEEQDVDRELLTVACLLHDIGRAEQFLDESVDHATCGAKKARTWLQSQGYAEDFCEAVAHCIETHRFRSDKPPQSTVAKILFDADKLDVCGAIGIARTIIYKAQVAEPLYSLDGCGGIHDGSGDEAASFLQEYKYKLEKMYDKFYTKRATSLAAKRQAAARDFYESLLSEVRECYRL